MSIPTLLYGSKTWVIKKKDEQKKMCIRDRKIQTAELKFLRSVKRCNRRDHIRNEEMRSNLDIFAVNEKIKEYRRKWIQHIDRMEESRIPKTAKDNSPRGRKKVGRLKKRWTAE